jgi:sarcosine oxidase subunit alpha
VSARLPPVPGEWIDRTAPLEFRFERRSHRGFRGDVVTSALWANRVRILGRSFKYHRARGILSLANHDVNALVEDAEHMNLRADVTPLRHGLDVTGVNTEAGVERDRLRLLDKFSPFLPVGFYYKAFHWPRFTAARWESFFRSMSGLGQVRFERERKEPPKCFDFCDVLVIGAGASGLAAAIAAARAGAKVLVVEENARAGGSLHYARGGEDTTLDVLARLVAELTTLPNAELRTGTFAAGCYADHWVALVDAERLTKLRAKCVVFATGVAEQPAVFADNDTPGVMLASAAQRLIYRYAVKPGERALVATANREGYAAALDLLRFGVKVAAVVDYRPSGEASELRARVAGRGVEILPGFVARALREREIVSGAALAGVSATGEPELGQQRHVTCDTILTSVGFAPALGLASQAGALLAYDPELGHSVAQTLPRGTFATGRAAGVYELDDKLADGERAGLAAAALLGFDAVPAPGRHPARRRVSHPYPVVADPERKCFLDFDEDVHVTDVHNAAQEGFDSMELLKRYATIGMGPSQGKHANANTARVLAKLRGEPVAAVGATTARPFYHPVPLSQLAGRPFHPQRRTALHARHAAAGAVFFAAGDWLRPEYYRATATDAADAGVKADAVRREVRTVRTGVGLIDVGTLGKLDVFGADAAEFLERMYTGRFADMKVGATRYALRVDESGVIADDGVVARLSERHFYVTTTSSASSVSYREFLRYNVEFRLEVGFVNVTGARAAVNLAGPKSRAVLATLTALDLSDAAFPYLAVRQAEVAGIPARILRVGFVGELGYEIHVPSEYGVALWDALVEAGASAGIQPFGVEAQRVLRLEKAHPIVGQDTDGLTTPYDAALDWAVKLEKPFFVGQRSLRIVLKKQKKHRLVGFRLEAGAEKAPSECCLVIAGGEIAGRVTSVAASEAVGGVLGLAYVLPELAEPGTSLAIRLPNRELVRAVVAKTPFYDAGLARQKAVAA